MITSKKHTKTQIKFIDLDGSAGNPMQVLAEVKRTYQACYGNDGYDHLAELLKTQFDYFDLLVAIDQQLGDYVVFETSNNDILHECADVNRRRRVRGLVRPESLSEAFTEDFYAVLENNGFEQAGAYV